MCFFRVKLSQDCLNHLSGGGHKLTPAQPDLASAIGSFIVCQVAVKATIVKLIRKLTSETSMVGIRGGGGYIYIYIN